MTYISRLASERSMQDTLKSVQSRFAILERISIDVSCKCLAHFAYSPTSPPSYRVCLGSDKINNHYALGKISLQGIKSLAL